jgi:hypothetical protein
VRKVRKLATDIPENTATKYGHEKSGRWQMALSLSAALGEAARRGPPRARLPP